MDKSDNKRAIIVGIFLALGIVILFATVYTLGGSQKRFVKSIRLIAVFDDVEGLKAGNNVWFLGVKIGTVKTVSFYGTNDVMVNMNIEEESAKYIRKDARAKIGTEGLIGNRIIEIYGGTAQSAPVQNNNHLAVEHAVSTDEIMTTLQQNNKNLVDITNDFKLLSLKIVKGKGLAGAMLTDSLMGEQLKSIFKNLQIAAVNTNRVTASVSELTQKMNSKGGLANELLTDTTVFKNLKISIAQLQEAATSANGITANLKKTSDKLDSPDNAVGVLLNDKAVAATMKNTISNLESSTKKLDESMEALQHNFLLRGFFKKKEKEKQ